VEIDCPATLPIRNPFAMSKRNAAKTRSISPGYSAAKQRYADMGVDTDAVMRKLATLPISLHCWQGDDVGGFENTGEGLSGGIAVTGNHPGKARIPEELRADLDKALSLIPGKHRLNLHAFYGEFGGKKVDRDEIEPKHFKSWIDWAKSNQMGMDFNPTCFAHPKAADGFTLSHPSKGIRDFWIEHCQRSRDISAAMCDECMDSGRLQRHPGRSRITSPTPRKIPR
jgi:L-rhamnose isomerase